MLLSLVIITFYNIEVKAKCFNTTGVDPELITDKSLEYIFNPLGIQTTIQTNKLLFYRFSDGTIEKRFIIE